jgi:hypothetical protein
MTVLLVVAVAAGVLILLTGLRGRMIGDRPLCRRCWHDQTNRPTDSTRCAECGADLTIESAVRIGRRVRRWGLISVALLPLLSVTAWLLVQGGRAAQRVNWLQFATVNDLLARASSQDGSLRHPAFAELCLRDGLGRLDRNCYDSIIAAAIASRADVLVPWESGWHPLAVSFLRQQVAPSDRWSAYIASLVRGASSADSTRRVPAIAELNDLPFEKLTTGQQTAIADAAVRYFADPQHLREDGWLPLVWTARRAGLIDDGHWHRLVDSIAADAASRPNPALGLLSEIGRSDPKVWDCIVEKSLALQADRTRQWDEEWKGLLAFPPADCRMTEAQRRRYAAQSWAGAISVKLRPKIREGDPLAYTIQVHDCRGLMVLAMSDWVPQLTDDPNVILPDPPEPPVDEAHFRTVWMGDGNWEQTKTFTPVQLTAGLKPGVHHLRLTTCVRSGPPSWTKEGRPETFGLPEPLSVAKVVLNGSFEVLPGNTAMGTPDLHSEDEVKSWLEVWTGVAGGGGAPDSVCITVVCKSPASDLAFDVFVREEGVETRIDSFTCPKSSTRFQTLPSSTSVPANKVFDIILRSNPKLTAESIDINNPWKGEVIFRDLEVRTR